MNTQPLPVATAAPAIVRPAVVDLPDPPAAPVAPIPTASASTPPLLNQELRTANPSATPGSVATAPRTVARDQADEEQSISDPQVRTLCESLKSDKPRDVIEALKVLRRIYATEAVAQILPCLNHYDPEVVREACRALAVLGNKDVIPSLQPLLQDHREDIRRDAQFAVKELASKT